MAITFSGTIKDDQNGGGAAGEPVEGMTVNLVRDSDSAVVDSTQTDANGDYSVNDPATSGDYHVDPQPLAPHWGDPTAGASQTAPGSFVQDFFNVPFSNNPPNTPSMADKSYEADSGTAHHSEPMSDPDGDAMTPRKVAGPSWGTVSLVGTDAQWAFDTAGVTPDTYTFEWDIQDEYGGDSGNDVFDVTITPANRDPDLINPGTQNFLHNSGNQTFILSATDPDGDDVDFSKDSGPAWVTVNAETGEVTVDTDVPSRGTYSVTWDATDNNGGFDTETHDIVIENNDPVLDSVSDKSFPNNSGLKTFTLSATDIDGDSFTFSKQTGPAWVTVEGDTVTVDTDAGSKGQHSATYQVTDGNGGQDTDSHTITLTNNNPVLDPPATRSYYPDIGIQTYQLTATDADGDDLTFSKVSGPSWGTVDADGLVTLDTSGVVVNTYTFQWRVTDGTGINSKNQDIVIEMPSPSPEFQVVT